LHHRAAEEGEAVLRYLEVGLQLHQERYAPGDGGRELRQQREAVPERGQIAWPGVLQRHSTRDALDVGEATQHLVDTRVSVGERGDRVVARREGGLVAQGLVDPVA